MCIAKKRKEILKPFTDSKDLLNELLRGVDCEVNIDVSLLKKGGDLTLPRWTARVDAVSSLMAQYRSVQSAMCKIEIVPSSYVRTNAVGYRLLLEDPEFIVAFVVVQFVLSLLKSLTLFLQKIDCSMVSALNETKILIQQKKKSVCRF